MENQEIVLKNLGPMEIQEYQQNRPPCFFLDMVEEAVPGKYAKGYKNFSYNEWFFPCHFEDEPNVPGFIQVEVLAQMFLMTFLTLPENKGKKTAFVSINNTKFKKKIVPGMKLDVMAEIKSYHRGVAKGTSIGYIDGEICCSADLKICVPDIINEFRPDSAK